MLKKSLKKHLLLTSLLLVLGTSSLMAQWKVKSSEELQQQQVERMAQNLDLTEAQKAEILAIHREYTPKTKATGKERWKNGDSGAFMAQMKAKRAAIQAVLTPEQKAKQKALRQKRKK